MLFIDAEKIELAVEGGLDSLFNLYAYDDDQVRTIKDPIQKVSLATKLCLLIAV